MNTLPAVANRIRNIFSDRFGHSPRLFRSPGRINLIGEHTDYNAGFVLPAGIDKAVYFAISPRKDDRVLLYAADLDRTWEFQKDDLSAPSEKWAVYQLGILDQLKKRGLDYGGFQAVFGGDIPAGAGMSSSAALECCLAFALSELFGYGFDKMTVATLSQRAENEYVGVKCGIMDQFASAFAVKDKVIRLDCRSLEHAYFPFPMDVYSIALCDTGVKHSLADSAYNTRRNECENGISVLQRHYPGLSSLRESSPEQVLAHREELEDNVYLRCKFVTEEIRRVEEACRLLQRDDLAGFGQKMYDTHHGLQHEYDVSCPELDFLVAQTLDMPGVPGARMMGGGFGGCTINLVANSFLPEFETRMKKAYREKFGRDLPVYKTRIENGTEELS